MRSTIQGKQYNLENLISNMNLKLWGVCVWDQGGGVIHKLVCMGPESEDEEG